MTEGGRVEQRRESEKEVREGRREEGKKERREKGREVYLKVKVNEGLLHNLLGCGGGRDRNVDLPNGCLQ